MARFLTLQNQPIPNKLLLIILFPLLGLLSVIGYITIAHDVSVATIVLLTMIALAVVTLFTLTFVKSFSSRIRLIRNATIDLAQGDLNLSLPSKGNDEISQITEALNKVALGLKEKAEFTTQIESGNLNASYTPFSDADLLGHSLLRMKEALVRIKTEDVKRNWAAEGLAMFAGILQTAKDLKSLSEEVIKNLVKTLQATQGTVFILNETETPFLEMTACYAYDRRKYINKHIAIGEGLVGQAYLEKRIIYLKKVPNDYVRITSGLGEANPTCLLIVPLIANEVVAGVLELASFKEFEKYRIDFTEKLAQNIAHTIINYRINENTRHLLEESQKKTEQMRMQEENLKQNQEELQATQEEISRKYDALFNELIDLNYQSKFDQLKSINATKKRNIEYYFDIIRKQILTYAENSTIIEAVKQFKIAFNQLPDTLPTEKLKALSDKLQRYYDHDFIPKLNENSEILFQVEKYLPKDARTVLLQDLYISSNPYPTGKKYLLNKADADYYYNDVHATYHPQLRSFLENFGYYDIFLIDHETGNMVYSVFKEVDFGTSLTTGIYSNTNFGNVVKAAIAGTTKDFVKLIDFQGYDPSYGAPASFIACPVYDKDTKVGILVFQMPINKINQLLTGDNKWEEDGLGASGETVIVGADSKLRSISRQLVQNPDAYFSAMASRGYSTLLINQIKKANTSILLEDVKRDSVKKALQNQTGTLLEKNDLHQDILTAYAPLEIQDVNWVILSSMSEQEASQKIKRLRDSN